MNGKDSSTDITPNTALVKMVVRTLVSWLLIAVLLFLGAGRFDWGLGWLFFVIWGVLKLLFIFILRLTDPDLLVERTVRHENTQPYDRIILPVYFIFSFGTILVAGIDGGRFHRSVIMPASLIIMAYIVYLLGNGLASWAVGANPFFSSESRYQEERGQDVVRVGPYRFVRHPAYLAAVLMWPVTGLLLNSWWAVVPGVLAAVMMFIRTVCEDRMLQTKLPGYREYARQVRFKLLPGIW